jgi:23S rRNA (uridine2552-2'-O)-methyltransferase
MSKPRRGHSSWRQRQERDPYVQKARREGWRSRAVYKLQEIAARERILSPGMVCIDLGAAPGGWSQYVSETLKGRARILAVDILPMDALAGVDVIQGDFTEDAVLAEVHSWLEGAKADLVMSDMAPNISGLKAVDQPRSMYLAELAFELAARILRPGGNFVCKLFQGEGTDTFIRDARVVVRSIW